MKLLVVAAEPVDADMVRAAVGEDAEGAEVLVVSPALNESRLAFWVSDTDEAIERADAVQEETVQRLGEEGIDAAGDTGESEPLTAIGDALAGFEADRILIFAHPEGERAFKEDELAAAAHERFGVPVITGTISR